jgi:hypothetical protein
VPPDEHDLLTPVRGRRTPAEEPEPREPPDRKEFPAVRERFGAPRSPLTGKQQTLFTRRDNRRRFVYEQRGRAGIVAL